MNFIEAMKAVRDGKKVRGCEWGSNAYIHKVDDEICYKSGSLYDIHYEVLNPMLDGISGDWVIVEDNTPKYCDKCGQKVTVTVGCY